MPELVRLKRKRRRVCAGDLDSRVKIENRSQVPPVYGAADAAFAFGAVSGDGYVWAKVETSSGKTVFDGVSFDRRITHRVTIRQLAGVTAQSWVLLADGTRLDVVQVETFDERGQFMDLLCDARGDSSRAMAGL